MRVALLLAVVAYGLAAQAAPGPSALVKRVVDAPPDSYFVYPHANGFLAGGKGLIVASQGEKEVKYFSFDPATGEAALVATVAGGQMYYSLSATDLLATTAGGSIVVVDLKRAGSPARVIATATPPWKPSMPDISTDGKTVMTDFHNYTPPGTHQIRVFDVESGNPDGGRVLLEKNWLLNHVHRSPADPNWVLFSHEGQGVEDRMWAWHAEKAPNGRALFNQIAPNGQPLSVGHEVAMHDKAAALAVAFGHSAGSPRGLYEVGLTADGAPQEARPLSYGFRDWHCSPSADGRWAVVDTMGPSDESGPALPGWAEKGGVSDILAVNLRTGARQFLQRAGFERKHPWHPHPVISPDGRWVVFNDAGSHRARAIEVDQVALEAFLTDNTPQQIPAEPKPISLKPGTIPWDMKELSRAPATYPVPEADVPRAKGERAIYFDGPPYQGKPTKVFAWVGLPEGASSEKKVPGIVLVHGSGASAYAGWVRAWNARGYAAIALDHNGGLPVGKQSKWKRNPEGGPNRNDLDFMDAPMTDQWMYHAVADTILAHSVLAALPEVDAERIGITGISLGGTITSTVAGVDPRLKFAAPVYGCGHTGDEVEDGSRFIGAGKGTPEQRAKWRALWDPALYLPLASSKLPILWTNGTNDFAFTLRSWQLSYRDAKGPRWLSLHLRMPHGHVAGEGVAEIPVFADSVVRGGLPLAKLGPMKRSEQEIVVSYDSQVPVANAECYFTRDDGRWQDRLWESVPTVIVEGKSGRGEIKATLPEGAIVYFINLTDARGLVVSTEHGSAAGEE